MNIIHKFRGKCVSDSKYADEWVTGGVVYCEKSEDVLIVSAITPNVTFKCHVKPETVGQFTGLYDKNNNEIYDGDILQLDYPEWNHIVFWDDSQLKWAYRKIGETQSYSLCMSPMNLSHYEVIGNIYDNPELLK